MEQGEGPAKPALEGSRGAEKGGLPMESREGVGKRTEHGGRGRQEEIGRVEGYVVGGRAVGSPHSLLLLIQLKC